MLRSIFVSTPKKHLYFVGRPATTIIKETWSDKLYNSISSHSRTSA
jgi:hypothetical protein